MIALLVLAALPALAARPDLAAAQDPAEALVAREWLVLQPVDRRGRRPFKADAVFARHLLDSDAPFPKVGDSVSGELGEAHAWRAAEADAEGMLEAGEVGYACAMLDCAEERVWLAELQGASRLMVNGEAFVGDPYRFGFRGVPVHLREGGNALFVSGVRGSFRLRFHQPEAELLLCDWDATLPDFVAGEGRDGWLALPLMNATAEPLTGLQLVIQSKEFRSNPRVMSGSLPPLGVLKAPVRFRGGRPPSETPQMTVEASADGEVRSSAVNLFLAVREAGATRQRTFLSEVDASVQRYAEVPPATEAEAGVRPGLVVSLHGAGVTAMGQAACYARKPGFWILCPENRRSFGFDWQDWGRTDAYEAIKAFRLTEAIDSARVCLTGHSMGGHGTWHLAANDPDAWAAIAPSAGWTSFDEYGGRPLDDGRWDELWRRADATSLTLELLPNLKQLPTYILHGENDDNVPATHAERMREALTGAGAPPGFHLQEGAGHWWGNACVDWPGIFELFDAARREEAPGRIDFLSVDPAVDADHEWLRVEQTREYGRPLRVRGEWDPEKRAVSLRTENVAWLSVSVRALGGRVDAIELDGTPMPPPEENEAAEFAWREGAWTVAAGRPGPGEKRAAHSGPFKRAFDRYFVLVYGTAGSDEESQASLARARYDSEIWWYRGNGRAPVMSDREFLAGATGSSITSNVVVYGNADSNRAWNAVFGAECPISVTRGKISVGGTEFEGEDLGCVFVFPRAFSGDAVAAAFGDTGVAGARLGYTLAPFVSGVGYPDYAVFSSKVLEDVDGGVLAAGWFDRDWRLP